MADPVKSDTTWRDVKTAVFAPQEYRCPIDRQTRGHLGGRPTTGQSKRPGPVRYMKLKSTAGGIGLFQARISERPSTITGPGPFCASAIAHRRSALVSLTIRVPDLQLGLASKPGDRPWLRQYHSWHRAIGRRRCCPARAGGLRRCILQLDTAADPHRHRESQSGSAFRDRHYKLGMFPPIH
jgi:hypothetical protein